MSDLDIFSDDDDSNANLTEEELNRKRKQLGRVFDTIINIHRKSVGLEPLAEGELERKVAELDSKSNQL